MATAFRNYFVVTLLVALFRCHGNGALPNYNPNLRRGNGDREVLIEDYFCFGFSYWEVLSFLLVYDGIRLNLRYLKRILRSRWLRRRNIYSSIYEESAGYSRLRITVEWENYWISVNAPKIMDLWLIENLSGVSLKGWTKPVLKCERRDGLEEEDL